MPTKLIFKKLSFGNKFARTIWNIVWLIFCRFTPNPLHGWRCLITRLFGARLGKNIRLYPSAKIWAPWNLTIDDYGCLGPYVDCYSVNDIYIGPHSVVSQYSFLCTASHDFSDVTMPLITAPIMIRGWVWITADVFVAPGVEIGEGAVITARSSVFNDIKPWVIASGNPAQPIKKRQLKGLTDKFSGPSKS